MTHPTHEEWMDYLYGELEPKIQSSLTIHLRSCAECQANVVEWRGAMAELSTLAVPVRRDYRAVRRVAGWGIAAMLVFGAGLGAGRLAMPPTPAVDAAALREEIKSELLATLTTSLEPKIRENLKREFDAEWQATLTDARERLSGDLKQELTARLARDVGQMKRDIQEVRQDGKQTRQDAMTTQTESERKLLELLAAYDETRIKEREALVALVNDVDQRRIRDVNALRNDLETIALVAEGEFLRTRQGISQLVAYVQPSQSSNPSNEKGQER